MADITQPLLNDVTPSGTGTFYSAPFTTKDYREFGFQLAMPSTAAGSGTLDIYIEASDDFDAVDAEPERVRVLTLTDVDNSTTADKFTQVTGSTTLPSDSHTTTTLRQLWYFKGSNLPRQIRVKYIVGTANDFSGIRLDLLANNRV